MNTLVEEDQTTRHDRDASPQPITVNVTPIFGNGSICEIAAGDPASHSFVHGGLINLHGNSSFEVTWQLQSGTPAGLQFDTGNPIWSSQTQCPGSACNDPQINLDSCTSTTLVTTVTPQQPANAVHVSLGWSNGVRFDPIIINN